MKMIYFGYKLEACENKQSGSPERPGTLNGQQRKRSWALCAPTCGRTVKSGINEVSTTTEEIHPPNNRVLYVRREAF